MSDDTPTTTNPPSTTHPHGQALGLTGTPAAIHTKLACLTDTHGATVAELASMAGIGHSTTGKALVTLEKRGLALRTPGGHDGPRRTPDRWRATATPTTSDNPAPSDEERAGSQPEPATATLRKPAAAKADHDGAHTLHPASNTPVAPADSDTGATPAREASQDTESTDTECGGGDHNAEGTAPYSGGNEDHPDSGDAPSEKAASAEYAAPSEAGILPAHKQRLAPGALRQMVLDHLTDHPGEAFTATRISRTIEKSSGAIANALHTLTKQGHAEQVTQQPNTYRATVSDSTT